MERPFDEVPISNLSGPYQLPIGVAGKIKERGSQTEASLGSIHFARSELLDNQFALVDRVTGRDAYCVCSGNRQTRNGRCRFE